MLKLKTKIFELKLVYANIFLHFLVHTVFLAVVFLQL